MICPRCAAMLSEANFHVRDIGICPACAVSVVRTGETGRLGHSDDLQTLSAGEITTLRQARPVAWRNHVLARHAQIVGGR